MSSTQIQLESDRVVSVQTQSITALSSVRKGTIRKLEERNTVSTIELKKKINCGNEKWITNTEIRTSVSLNSVIIWAVCWQRSFNIVAISLTLGRGRGSGSCSSWWESCPGCGLGSHIWSGTLTGQSRYTSQSTRAEPLGSCWTSCEAKKEKAINENTNIFFEISRPSDFLFFF